ncbi:MAG: hypothetical protein AAFP87_05790 [Pseudomonadota bacterium]
MAIAKPRDLRQCFDMRPVLVLCLFCVLAACLPLRTFYAEGVSVKTLDRDNTACDVAALKAAPVANVVRQGPPRYVRNRVCDGRGNCYYSGGFWVPGEVYSVDANADLRARVKAQCMSDRGYAFVEIPACPPAVANAAPPGETLILPKLNENTCAIRNRNGKIQIVRTQ